jgi:Protein of unknown function (DUF2591)
MKVRVSEADREVLDWMVATCEGKELHYFEDDWFKKDPWLTVDGKVDQPLHSYTPSTDWRQGGPIIEREKITVGCGDDTLTIWDAYKREFLFEEDGRDAYSTGSTPLIAAMRCYVASRLGDEVDVPEELTMLGGTK